MGLQPPAHYFVLRSNGLVPQMRERTCAVSVEPTTVTKYYLLQECHQFLGLLRSGGTVVLLLLLLERDLNDLFSHTSVVYKIPVAGLCIELNLKNCIISWSDGTHQKWFCVVNWQSCLPVRSQDVGWTQDTAGGSQRREGETGQRTAADQQNYWKTQSASHWGELLQKTQILIEKNNWTYSSVEKKVSRSILCHLLWFACK